MAEEQEHHRHEKRIEQHFVLRARLADTVIWDVSTVRNISKTGVLFYSSRNYAHGSDLEIRIMNPLLGKEVTCFGKVVRCEPLAKMSDLYSVGIEITNIDDMYIEAFYKTIEYFISKNGDKRT